MIRLTRKALAVNTAGDNPCRRNWPIEIEAELTAGSTADPKIFVYHAASLDDPVRQDKFSNVASLQDMNIIPADAPAEVGGDPSENFIPYYRTSTLAFDCHNAEEAERIWTIVKYDTRQLIREYKANNTLQATEVIEIL